MKIKTQDIPALVNGLSLRERVILLIAILVVMGGLADQFLWSPVRLAEAQRLRDAETWTQEIKDINTRLFAAQAKASAAGNNNLNAKNLKVKVDEQKASLEQSISSQKTLSTDDVIASAKKLVKEYPKVQMQELTLESPKTLSVGEEENKIIITQHDMLLTVEGNYLDLLSYVKGLEKSLPGIRWSALHVEQKKDYSSTVLTVRMSHIQLPSDLLRTTP